MQNNYFCSVMTPAASNGSVSFNFQTLNATPNVSLTVQVTGITTSMSEKQIAYSICTQTSGAFYSNGILFQGVISPIINPVSGNFQTANTDHVVSYFSQAQYSITQVADTTGANYYLDATPVFSTVAEALSYGPLANALLQSCGGGSLSTQQVVDLLAMSSSEIAETLNNNIVSCFYVYYFSTLMTNALKLPNVPVQSYWNPYILRPTIIQLATQVATFDLASNYNIDYDTGWLTFRFAQDLLFNYEPFDYQNLFYLAYSAGWNFLPRSIKTACLKYAFLLQTDTYTRSLSDGVVKIEYEVDRNLRRREIFNTLRKYCQ